MTFTQRTTGSEVAHALASRCEGKTFVLTGASSNTIGGATAISLAHGHPKTLFLLARSASKVASVIKEIQTVDHKIDAVFIQMDLIDQESIRQGAKEILSSGKANKIHGLINCAGVMCVMPYTETKQGIEVQFGVNHIGHFLLTNLLLPRIIAAGPNSRIVNVASTGYMLGDVQLDNYNFDNGKTYHPWLAYAASKTANILFNTYLASHLKSKGVEAFALQPGMPQTDLYQHIRDDDSPSAMAEAYKIGAKKYGDGPNPSGNLEEDEKTVETAASTVVFAVLDGGLDGKSGLFLRNCKEFPVEGYTTDPEQAEKLWKLSERLVGNEFEI